jgi:hypothetical protein
MAGSIEVLLGIASALAVLATLVAPLFLRKFQAKEKEQYDSKVEAIVTAVRDIAL